MTGQSHDRSVIRTKMPTQTFFNLPADKRQRVVDAALDEFADHAYDAASISGIVARAGIAKGSFYHYFASKADLFEWLVFEELGRQKVAYMQSRPAPAGGDFFATLEEAVLAGYRWALDHPRLARITEAMWFPSADPDLRAMAARGRRLAQSTMISLLRVGQEAGQVRADLELDLAAAMLTAALQQGADRAMWERFGLDLVGLMRDPERGRDITDDQLRALVAGVIDLVRRGLGQPGGEWSPDRLDLERISADGLRDSQ